MVVDWVSSELALVVVLVLMKAGLSAVASVAEKAVWTAVRSGNYLVALMAGQLVAGKVAK